MRLAEEMMDRQRYACDGSSVMDPTAAEIGSSHEECVKVDHSGTTPDQSDERQALIHGHEKNIQHLSQQR